MSALKLRRVESRFGEVLAEGAPLRYGAPATSAKAVAELLRPIMADPSTEEFWLLTLDGKHRVIGACMVSRGTLTASLVHPREVFGPALRLGAAAIIVAHNHPSGDPEPSAEDLAVTRRMVDAGKLLGVPLLDHLVLAGGGDGYVSLRERMEFGA